MKGQLSSGLFWAEPWPGDLIAVCHDWWHAVSIFDSAGKYGRTLDLMPPNPPPMGPQCRDALPSGALVATRHPSTPANATLGVSRRSVEFLVLDADGTLRASLGVHPGAELYEYEQEDFLYFGDPPFMRTVVWAAWGELAIVSPTDRYEIRAYTGDGSLARIVRREHNVAEPHAGRSRPLPGRRTTRRRAHAGPEVARHRAGRLPPPRVLPRLLGHRGRSSRQPLGPRIQSAR